MKDDRNSGRVDARVGGELHVELAALRASARVRTFAERLLRVALDEIGDTLAVEGERLVATFDAHNAEFGVQCDAWRERLAAVGSTLDLTSAFLGAPTIGVRRPARPFAALLRAARLEGFVADRLPELRSTDLVTLATRALALTFWVERQRIAGARRVDVERTRSSVRMRASGGGQVCVELVDAQGIAARRTAFVLWPSPWFEVG